MHFFLAGSLMDWWLEQMVVFDGNKHAWQQAT
jgi:hypothetical protein